MPVPETIWFRYSFTLDDGRKGAFEVSLDPETGTIIRPPNPSAPPEWTELAYSPCSHCALPPEARHCPIAVNISDLAAKFGDVISCTNAEVVVETRERSYSKKGSVQEVLFPLIGIYMSGSGCPSMEKFKPLLRHHLPFATPEETIYRVVTMYVTAQYLRMQAGLSPDWELTGIRELYDKVNAVNREFCKRLNRAIKEDAMVNSIVMLDSLGYMVKSPTKESVETLRRLFAPYLAKPS
jgi:uncharacterized protein DUF6901